MNRTPHLSCCWKFLHLFTNFANSSRSSPLLQAATGFPSFPPPPLSISYTWKSTGDKPVRGIAILSAADGVGCAGQKKRDFSFTARFVAHVRFVSTSEFRVLCYLFGVRYRDGAETQPSVLGRSEGYSGREEEGSAEDQVMVSSLLR